MAHLLLAYAGGVGGYLMGTVFWGLHMGFSQGRLVAMLVRVTPPGLKARAFGAFNLMTGIVVLLANVAAGWFWQSQGSAAPFLIGAGVSTAAMLLVALGGRRAGLPGLT